MEYTQNEQPSVTVVQRYNTMLGEKTSVVMHRTNYPGKRASLSGILIGPILGLFGAFFVGIPQPLILGATLRPSTHLISIIKSLSFYFGVCVCVYGGMHTSTSV